MGMAYIRKTYGVPAKRGMVIKYRGIEVIIVGSAGAYLRVRNVAGSDTVHHYNIHPTWNVEYPRQEGAE